MSYNPEKSAPPMGPPPPYSVNQPGQAPLGFSAPPPMHQQHTVHMQPVHASSSTVVMQPAMTTTYVVPGVVPIGTCPACRVGVLTSEFTCCGICLAICFFPLGMLCCFLMMEKRCTNCRAVYG